MNELIFILAILIILIIAFIVFKGYLSPSVELLLMYFVSAIFYLLNKDKWEVNLSNKTIIIVISALVFFVLGECLSLKIPNVKKTHADNGNDINGFTNIIYIIGILLGLLTVYLRYKYSLKVLDFMNYNKKYLLTAMHDNFYLTNKLEEPQINTWLIVICDCFSFYNCYFFIANLINKRKFRIKFLIPFLISFFYQIFSGGRTFIIRDLIYLLFIYSIFIYKKYSYKKATFNISILGLLSICIFFLFYFIYGFVRSGFLLGSHLNISYLLGYPASSIQAFNAYLQAPTEPLLWGEETFVIQKQILNKLGFSMETGNLALPYTYWQEYDTNIYTALRRYYHDFGFIGLCIIQFFLGFIYGYMKKNAVEGNRAWMTIFYAQLAHTVAMSLFDERFFQQVANAGTLYYLITLPIMSLLQNVSFNNLLNKKVKKWFET